MTQEDRELLLKDLSGRLPYEVKVLDNSHKNYGVSKLINIGIDGSMLIDNETNDTQYYPIIAETKPYLRPLSSMTEEEKIQLSRYACIGEDLNGEFIDEVQRKDCAAYIDWLNAHHFDYRGLIPKGLAIGVTPENNPYES